MIEAARPAKLLREALRPFLRRFLWAAVYFLITFLIGMVGYAVIEPWSWFESLYMAVTTVTSVGFMEVRPLSPAGRSFTIVLIGLGLTGLGIWWALTTALIVEMDLAGPLRRRNMMNEISRLSHHFIVCGIGRMGRVVLEEMIKSAVPLVVIEKDPEAIRQLMEIHPRLLAIQDDATRERTLVAARIETARGLAACLTSDADNLLVCLTARGLRKDLNIVARGYDEETLQKLHRAGASHAISPNVTGGIRMASTLIRPSVVSFLDVSMTETEIELRLEQARIPPGSSLAGQSLAEAQIPQRTGLIVLALQRGGKPGNFIYNPGPETRFEAGDVMLVLGRPEQLAELRRYVSASTT
jgi:voltage-gated potassium channel